MKYTTRKCCCSYHAIENTVANPINVAHDGKVGCNTDECTTAFLYSDWLYFLSYGINRVIKSWIDVSIYEIIHIFELRS